MQQFADSSQSRDTLDCPTRTHLVTWRTSQLRLAWVPTGESRAEIERESVVITSPMVSRREPRKDIRVSVRIFGTDIAGKAFSENVYTVNVSRAGAMVIEVKTQLKIGETIGLAYGASKSRYQVRWVKQSSGAEQALAGLQNIKTEEVVWDFPLPAPGTDEPVRTRAINERREQPRYKCSLSVELHPASGENRAWGRVADISLGGCFVEMPSPFKEGTQIRLALWIQDKKIWALGKVAGSRPGSGIGIQFLEMKEEDRAELKRFVDSLPSLRR
jgi:hypothetical protein